MKFNFYFLLLLLPILNPIHMYSSGFTHSASKGYYRSLESEQNDVLNKLSHFLDKAETWNDATKEAIKSVIVQHNIHPDIINYSTSLSVLHAAVLHDDVPFARFLIRAGANSNAMFTSQPLIQSCKTKEMAELFLKHMSPEIKAKYGNDLMDYVVQFVRDPGVLSAYLAHGFSPNCMCEDIHAGALYVPLNKIAYVFNHPVIHDQEVLIQNAVNLVKAGADLKTPVMALPWLEDDREFKHLWLGYTFPKIVKDRIGFFKNNPHNNKHYKELYDGLVKLRSAVLAVVKDKKQYLDLEKN